MQNFPAIYALQSAQNKHERLVCLKCRQNVEQAVSERFRVKFYSLKRLQSPVYMRDQLLNK